MRHTASKVLGLWAVVTVLSAIVLIGLAVPRTAFKRVFFAVGTVLAQTHTSDATEGGKDSVLVGDEQKRFEREEALKKVAEEEGTTREKKGMSIRIDESGIRIEGSVSDDAGSDSTEHRIIFDTGDWTNVGEKRRYREKGADIARFGEDVTVDTNELVRGDLVVFGGDASIAGKVIGNVVVIVGDVRVRSGAEINGDVVVLGGDLDEEPEVIIHGERVVLKSLGVSFARFPFFFGHHMRPLILILIPVFFISVVLSFLILLFLRDRVIRSQEHVVAGALKSFGSGFLVAFVGTFVVSILTTILVITLIGIPLAFVLIVSCGAVYIIADTVFVYALGAKMNEKLKIETTNPFAIVFVGMAVLYLPGLIGFGFSLLPFGGPLGTLFTLFGVLFGLFAFLAGLGALFLSRFGSRSARSAPSAPAQTPPAPDPVSPQ